jgi:hypothetical protein
MRDRHTTDAALPGNLDQRRDHPRALDIRDTATATATIHVNMGRATFHATAGGAPSGATTTTTRTRGHRDHPSPYWR